MTLRKVLGIGSLMVAGAMLAGSAMGQAAPQSPAAPLGGSAQGAVVQGQSDPAGMPAQTTDGVPAYATGKPLEMQSNEGFWGHLNPFARKKWVHRQVDPIKDRANELDELQAKNAGDIKDVDARATAGVNRAMGAAATADAHAADAAGKADAANSLAVSADGKTTALNGTVSNLDQYSEVSTTALPFVAGHHVLTARQKASLDEVASSLATEKGYLVEIEGFSRSGIESSQAMAESVVRYLVTAHQVPVYRIYRTGLGAQRQVAEDGTKPLSNGVRVTVLHNSLATMGQINAPAAPAGGSD